MAVYGNECGGGGFLLLDNENAVVGEYANPQNITEIYLGEPYITHISMGILGGRQAWQTEIRRGDGVLVGNYVTRDVKLNVTLTPPTTESGQWTRTWQSANRWNGSSWVPIGSGIDYSRIERYVYTITDA